MIPDYLAQIFVEDPNTGAELVDLFTREAKIHISELRKAVSEADAAQAKRLLHGLEGSCSQMGALDLTARCAELEANIDTSSQPETLLQIGEIERCYERLVVAILSTVARSSTSPE